MEKKRLIEWKHQVAKNSNRIGVIDWMHYNYYLNAMMSIEQVQEVRSQFCLNASSIETKQTEYILKKET